MLPRSGIERARLALMQGVPWPPGALSDDIAQSWQRCLALGLDPDSEPRANVIPFPDVARRREERALLRQLALAEMQLLHAQIAGSDFMIAFADPDGVVLDTVSDHRFAATPAGRSILPGSGWREDERGTNALGLAVMQEAPAAIYGREHFFTCHGHLSCLAVPIFDSAGRLAGVLDASCANEARQQHTHALLRMAAGEMENALIYRECPDALILAFHPRAEFLDTLSAGLIAVSAEGEIRALNRAGRAMLAGLDIRLGATFESLFASPLGPTMDMLCRDGLARLCDRAGSTVYIACRRAAGGLGRRQPAAPPAARSADPPAPEGFVCADETLLSRMRGLGKAVAARAAVLIRGETGTGKELMARHVHALSARKGPFVPVNCGAIPETLFIAELFGHERGAYTDARAEGAPGLAALADKGTLFLDEVADIPLAAQTALLRFLDTMEVRPVGGRALKSVDVQIVSATNVDLEAAMAERRFRPDLYYRLAGYDIDLPPLAEREDFAQIVRHVLAAVAPGVTITDAAVAHLAARPWPGNIRELQTTLRRAAAATDGPCLDEAMFAHSHAEDGVCAECAGHPLAALRCRSIRAAVTAAGGNVSVASRRLGISRTTIYKHLAAAGLGQGAFSTTAC